VYVSALEHEMLEHAKNLEFEEAAAIRDEIEKIRGALGGSTRKRVK
jgi:excinuclease ABC subunit B